MGDETRHWGPPFIENGTDKVASYFTAVNRNKRSVGIDLKAPEGRAIIQVLLLFSCTHNQHPCQRMASQVDVLIHNFIPSTAQKLGVDYETVSKLNPKLVYAELTGTVRLTISCTTSSVVGYGSSGPLAESPGMRMSHILLYFLDYTPGYDLVASAYSGLMHVTGTPTGPPVKVRLSSIPSSSFLRKYDAIHRWAWQ